MTGVNLSERYDLRSRLRFEPRNGLIWLGEYKMQLLHARALGALRRELIESLGIERARGLLVRMGFASGQQDAALVKRMVGDGDPADAFLLGPEMHALEGAVKTRIIRSTIDVARDRFEGEFAWEVSSEAEGHVQHFGIGGDPACWMQIGYASGYVTAFMNRFVVFRETQCICCGAAECRIVGKPAEQWNDPAYLAYFEPDNFQGEIAELREQVERLQASLRAKATPCQTDLIGASPAFTKALDLAGRAAPGQITVLLLGETGVGKERFARWVHDHSPRAAGPFVAVNCAAIPNDLIEAELFGVQKGAYTGAQQSRQGRFERAHGGTLFLDEVGDLSPSAQVKLLRVLQTGVVERLGGTDPVKVDVRLVAATNVDLTRAIAEGRFRADLYYRLGAYPVTIPPLRERRADIPLFVEALVRKYERLYDKRVAGLTDRARLMFEQYAWPGNIRELENALERGVLLAPPGGEIEISHLFAGLDDPQRAGVTLGHDGLLGAGNEAAQDRVCEELLADDFDLEAHERRLLDLAVRKAGGNLSKAARMLRITRRQLAYRLQARPAADAA
ncbi:sigma-54-dependent Fis family transcriptional regulator [Derxia gummosa]|uniref:Sigma-54-dependent Fis family transcriptional regulator n=1 Tax=Derxia gummosa DSM 723 TaxID=1121388 RepID=A0A8B6X4Z5_9BURK|nr:sigma-54-dependent Fis family transcriptional regulator [Derxia gummosa]